MTDVVKTLFKGIENASGVPVFTLILGVFFFVVSNPLMYGYVRQLFASIPGFPSGWMKLHNLKDFNDRFSTEVYVPTQAAVLLHTVVFLLLLMTVGGVKIAFTKK